MIEEIWKDIEGYDGFYKVSNKGNVISEKGLLKQQIVKGYCHVELKKEGHRKNASVHRLVALAFLPNPNNFPVVNHKDENRSNNKVENLEWCTQSYNMKYSSVHEKAYNKTRKGVYMYTKEGKYERYFSGLRDAARYLNDLYPNVRMCCNKRNKICKGHMFRWAKEGFKEIIEPYNDFIKQINVIDKNGNIVYVAKSAHDAAKYVNGIYQCVLRCCNNDKYTHKGFKFNRR